MNGHDSWLKLLKMTWNASRATSTLQADMMPPRAWHFCLVSCYLFTGEFLISRVFSLRFAAKHAGARDFYGKHSEV